MVISAELVRHLAGPLPQGDVYADATEFRRVGSDWFAYRGDEKLDVTPLGLSMRAVLHHGLQDDHHEADQVIRDLQHKRDWVGMIVKLKRDMSTRGGTVLAAGTVMRVDRNWGGLHLSKEDICSQCGCGNALRIHGVNKFDVELI